MNGTLKSMQVASYNVHKCRGADGRYRPDRIAAVLAEIGADLVALQEVDRRFGRRVGLLDPQRIMAETGLHLLVQSDLEDGHGWHGNALLVRGDPISYRRTRMRLPGIEPRGAVVAELDLGQGPFRVVAAHLGLNPGCRSNQAEAIMAALAASSPLPTVVLGDLNEWRPKGSALGVLAPWFGLAPSRPSYPSRLPMFSLDRILGWPRGLVSDVEVHDTPLARKASDHLPLKAQLNLKISLPALPFAA